MRRAPPCERNTTKAMVEHCIECGEPVAGPTEPIEGTARYGSAYWCARHEAERVDRITRQLEALANGEEVPLR